MKEQFEKLSPREKLLLLLMLGLLVASVLYHNHPHMDGLQEQLRSKAPALFKLFVVGEGVYFSGMLLMAAGLGASLGPNPLLWAGKLKELLSAASPGLARGGLFWLGFACNVIGSLTFGLIGIYVAAEILPNGSKTLIPASIVDIGFSLLVRYLFYRRFRHRLVASPS